MGRNQKIDPHPVLARVQGEGPDAILTRGEAAAILDLLLDGSSSYQRRKQLGDQLDIASRPRGRRGRIPGISKVASGFTADDLVHWAKEYHRQDLVDLPRRPRCRQVRARFNDVAVVSDSVEMVIFPGTIDRCHDELRRAHAQIREMKLALAAREREIAGKEMEFRDRVTARLKRK